VNSRVFCQDVEHYGRACPSRTENETGHRLRAMDVGALTTLRTFAPTNQKSRMMVTNLDWLTPYQGAARDERP
jgi:hypothetical protein